MSVKKKDRHVAGNESLNKSRVLTHQVLILTRPREFDPTTGKQIRKPGILAEGQPFYAFGNDLLTLSKKIHGKCYEAFLIHLHDKETLNARKELLKDAVKYCDSIMRLLDLCIHEYGGASRKKRRSFAYVAKLTYDTKKTIQDRINRDNLIYEHKYNQPQNHRRGR